MSRSQAFLSWLEDKSDWLSPIVVKEMRQVVRGREFNYAFSASLVGGLGFAAIGAADAATGSGTAGRWTFMALMTCLSFLALAVVPLGAFSALRNERMEQTLDLITLTALSPRRVVIGKLLAQAVKLMTLFAAVGPFIATSFLLGGIDFVTILVSLSVLFMWSVWVCGVCLFASTLLNGRAASGLVFGAMGIVAMLLLVIGRSLLWMARGGGFGPVAFGLSLGTGTQPWWMLAMATTFCVASLVNLVLLAENRLSLPTENKATALRVGFLVQFLLIGGWLLTFLGYPASVLTNAVRVLGVAGGLHLALVAAFTVTEDLVLPRRALLRMKRVPQWRWLLMMLRPGGGCGAVYVLAQMALLLATAWLLRASWVQLRWLMTICGYICFFTGVPTAVFRLWKPAYAASLKLRVAILAIVSVSLILPDIVFYVFWQPAVLNVDFSARHLINPFRTLANWQLVESRHWLALPIVYGVTGLLAYLTLIYLGRRLMVQSAALDARGSAAAAGEPGSAGAVY